MTGNDEVGDDKDEQASKALAIGAIRNALLPENALSARFTTTAGPNLSPVSGTVYVGSYEGAEQRILWFKIEERFLPTGEPKTHGAFAAQLTIAPSLHTMVASSARPPPSHSRLCSAKAS